MKKPTLRIAKIIAEMIRGGKIKKNKLQMFSIDRCRAVSEDVAITITTRVNGSDLFYVFEPNEKTETENSEQ